MRGKVIEDGTASGDGEANGGGDGFPTPASERPSKSQRKREMLALQGLAEHLLGCGVEELQRLPFAERLVAALLEGRRIASHAARRRQIRYIAGLLDGEAAEDLDRVRQAVASRRGQGDTRVLHFAEHWRERLLATGEAALAELLQLCPEADRQQILGLILAARQEQALGKPPAARRRLFRTLSLLMRNPM
jgi:ribosome-associated protein